MRGWLPYRTPRRKPPRRRPSRHGSTRCRGIYPDEDRAAFEAALAYARERCGDARGRDGEPLIDRAVGTAMIVAGLKLDAGTVRAALLTGLAGAHAFDADDVAARFGADAATLVAGAARMDEIRAMPPQGDAAERAAQAERLRKMLLAMVEDIRVVLIKLAERTAALRFLMAGGAADRAAAAGGARGARPLRAARQPARRLAAQVGARGPEPARARARRRTRRSRRCWTSAGSTASATSRTSSRCSRASSPRPASRAEITGRPKHIYSIWHKMRRKQSGIDSLYDIRAVRILVDDVKDCYAALGIVHHLWTPLPREFDDYIAKPKANDYRSLHTAVIGPEGKPLEVQIRTREMHQHSEYGVAAHWRYKEGAQKGARRDPAFEDRIAWLRQVLDWKDAVADASRVARRVQEQPLHRHHLRADAAGQGRRPAGGRDAGRFRVRGAHEPWPPLPRRARRRRDGAANHPLKNGQRVEIVAAKQGGPSRDWLNPELGYAHSHRARAKVRQWFKAQQHEETLAQGRAIVERELQRAGATAVSLDAVAAKAGFAQADELYAAVGRAELNTRQIVRRRSGPWCSPTPRPNAERGRKCVARQSKAAGSGSGILVVGVDRLMTNLARCCKPAPPDGIVGFVTRGKGVTIHRQRCSNVVRMRAREPERLIDADWGKARDEVFPGRRRARGDGPAGPAARHHRDLLARADQRHGGEHAHAQQRDADGVHARGEEPRRARPRALARQGREGRAERRTAVTRLRRPSGA